MFCAVAAPPTQWVGGAATAQKTYHFSVALRTFCDRAMIELLQIHPAAREKVATKAAYRQVQRNKQNKHRKQTKENKQNKQRNKRNKQTKQRKKTKKEQTNKSNKQTKETACNAPLGSSKQGPKGFRKFLINP